MSIVRAATFRGAGEIVIEHRALRPAADGEVRVRVGAGIKLVEIQQNSDLTYRLYDYGRPRELHLAESMSVSKTEP